MVSGFADIWDTAESFFHVASFSSFTLVKNALLDNRYFHYTLVISVDKHSRWYLYGMMYLTQVTML